MKPISQAASHLLADLRANLESGKTTEPDGSRAKFGGLLLALKDAGYYQPVDSYFGSVKL